MTHHLETVAVLCSGGLDSVVLAAAEARDRRVVPVYVRAGLAWEDAERQALERALVGMRAAATRAGRLAPSFALDVTMRDVYQPSHWAMTGSPPAYDTPDEDVYLPGRNVILLAKAAVFCAGAGIHRVATGQLAGNPFPDATAEFFAAMARALSLGLAHDIEIAVPFARLHKADVIRLGVELGVPLDLSLSCMSPQDGRHCGLCSKCRERRDGFAAAGVEDRTVYARASPR